MDENTIFDKVHDIDLKKTMENSYIDYAMGKHQAWLGPDWDAFGPGWGSNSWHARFNINIGYYF